MVWCHAARGKFVVFLVFLVVRCAAIFFGRVTGYLMFVRCSIAVFFSYGAVVVGSLGAALGYFPSLWALPLD